MGRFDTISDRPEFEMLIPDPLSPDYGVRPELDDDGLRIEDRTFRPTNFWGYPVSAAFSCMTPDGRLIDAE